MNSFSKILTATALVAGSLSLVPNALASSISFGSYVGATAPAGFTDSPIVSGAIQATGTPVFASPYSYTNVLPGTMFVSSTNSTNAPTGTTNYFTTVSGGFAGEGGSISVAADDTVQVFLNGVLIGDTAPSTYDTIKTFGFTFASSSNVFEFVVNNIPNGSTFNPSGVDFLGTAATPEPSSLVLLGSGLISAAGMVIRKRRVKA